MNRYAIVFDKNLRTALAFCMMNTFFLHLINELVVGVCERRSMVCFLFPVSLGCRHKGLLR